MAKRKGMGKILGFKPTTLALIGVGAYLLKDKLFKPTPTTMTAKANTNPNSVVTPS